MTCLFDPEVTVGLDFDHMRLYERAVDATLKIEGCPFEVCVALLYTDDENIRNINRESRDIDSTTDVLSFPMLTYTAPSDFSSVLVEPGDIDPETGEVFLGDIVISQDHVLSQAEKYGHDPQREFAFLIVHSMLHLCGYDHIEEEDRILMESRQKLVMESLYEEFPKLAV